MDQPFEFYMEATPNPNAIKFVSSRQLLVTGAIAEYSSPPAIQEAPLVYELFKFACIQRVLISSFFITLTKTEDTDWYEIQNDLRVFLNQYCNALKPIVLKLPVQHLPEDSVSSKTVAVNTQHASPANAVEAQIIEVLEQYIRPAVEQDGGLITFKSLHEGVVTVQMRGSCSGCPSSTQTLKSGIEGVLKRILPEHVKAVISEAV